MFCTGIWGCRFKPELWWLKPTPFIPKPAQEFWFGPNSGLWRFGPLALVPESALDPRLLKLGFHGSSVPKFCGLTPEPTVEFGFGAMTPEGLGGEILRLGHWIPQLLWKRLRPQPLSWQLGTLIAERRRVPESNCMSVVRLDHHSRFMGTVFKSQLWNLRPRTCSQEPTLKLGLKHQFSRVNSGILGLGLACKTLLWNLESAHLLSRVNSGILGSGHAFRTQL